MQPDTPFASAVIADPNFDTSDSLSIRLTGAGGTLTDGAGFDGLTSSGPGVYLLSGTAAAITSELEALIFTPGADFGTTTFTLTDTSSAGTRASDANTTVNLFRLGAEIPEHTEERSSIVDNIVAITFADVQVKNSFKGHPENLGNDLS